MNRLSEWIQLLSGAAAALIWRYALVDYTFLSLKQPPYPMSAAIVALVAAALTTTVAKGRGLRIIYALLIQLFGMLLAGLTTLHACFPLSHPYISFGWFSAWISQPRDGVTWALVALVLAAMFFFWYGGWFLIPDKKRPYSSYHRFDLGVTFFILLFLTKFLFKTQGNINVADPLAMPLFVAFLIFGLISLGVARLSDPGETTYLPGYRTLGTLASFAVLIVLIGIGVSVVLMPYLTRAADTGYQALTVIARPLGGWITDFLRMMLSHRRSEDAAAAGGQSGNMGIADLPAKAHGGSADWFIYILLALLGIVALIAAFFLLRMLIAWLLSRTPKRETAPRGFGWRQFLYWIKRLTRRLLVYLGGSVIFKPSAVNTAGHWYGLLIKWGRRSGMAHLLTETAREYGIRLKSRFPMLSHEMDVIVTIYNTEAYGGRPPDPADRTLVATAWRNIRSPRHWGRRLCSWVRRS